MWQGGDDELVVDSDSMVGSGYNSIRIDVILEEMN